jgi:hypothetical protein
MERDLKHELKVTLKELQQQVAAPPPKAVIPMRQVTPTAPRAHKTRQRAKPAPAHSALRTPPPALPTAAPVHERRIHKAARPTHHKTLFKLPAPSDNQAMSAGSSGGTSTPPPAPIAVLLAAACLAASMLVTSLWDAHRRRRSRLFASRLERPG